MAELSTKAQCFIFIMAYALRAGYVIAQNRYGVVIGDVQGGDAALYLKLAESLMAGRGFATGGGSTAWVMPGYPLFLSACYWLVGWNPERIGLIQSVFSAAACLWIGRSAALLFSARVGWIAGIIGAVYYELILWTSGQLLTEPLYFFLIASALYATVVAFTAASPKPWRFFLAGGLFGLSALARPLALGLGLGMAGALLARSLWATDRRRQWLAVAFAASCVVVLLPWGIRNSLSMGYFTLVSTEGGHVFWLGNNPAYDRKDHPDFERFGGYTAMIPPLREVMGKSEVEANRIFYKAAMQHIASHPGLWVARAAHKTWNMWRPVFSQSSSRHKLIGWTLYPALLGLSLVGLCLSWPLRDRVWPLWVFLLLNLLAHSAITGEIRFRVPLWAALMPFAALSLSRVVGEILKPSDRGPAGERLPGVPRSAPQARRRSQWGKRSSGWWGGWIR